MSPPSDKALTGQQQRVLQFVEQFLAGHGFPPTLREIGAAIGLANLNAVRGHLAALEKKGYISKAPDKARSIQVIRSPSAFSLMKRKLHEVLGTDEGVLHQIVYGLAWPTRGRAAVLVGPRAQRLEEAFARAAVEHGWTILETRLAPDHVVLIVQAWHSHSAQQVVQRLQAAGSAVRRRLPQEFPRGRLWGRGYVATTDLERLSGLVDRLLEMQQEQECDRGATSEPIREGPVPGEV
jgi:REP element-mobilizing transposase RayT